MLGPEPVRPPPASERELLADLDVLSTEPDEPLDAPDDDDDEASDDGFGDDSFLDPGTPSPYDEELEREDLSRRPIKLKLTPQLRQLSKRQQNLCANAEPSWWTKPDADWPAEQQRMRENPKAPRIPSQNAVIGWKAVF